VASVDGDVGVKVERVLKVVGVRRRVFNAILKALEWFCGNVVILNGDWPSHSQAKQPYPDISTEAGEEDTAETYRSITYTPHHVTLRMTASSGVMRPCCTCFEQSRWSPKLKAILEA
jgi:hypothetical protein